MLNINLIKVSKLNPTGLVFSIALLIFLVLFSVVLIRYDARQALPGQIKAISENINQSLSYKMENTGLKETLSFVPEIKKEYPHINEASLEFSNMYHKKITSWQKENVDYVISLVNEAINNNSSDLTYYDHFYLPLILNNFYMFSSSFDDYQPLSDMRNNLRTKLLEDGYEAKAAQNAQANLDLICATSSIQSMICKIKNEKMKSTYSYLTGSAINYHKVASSKLMVQGFKELEKTPKEIRENYSKVLVEREKKNNPVTVDFLSK